MIVCCCCFFAKPTSSLSSREHVCREFSSSSARLLPRCSKRTLLLTVGAERSRRTKRTRRHRLRLFHCFPRLRRVVVLRRDGRLTGGVARAPRRTAHVPARSPWRRVSRTGVRPPSPTHTGFIRQRRMLRFLSCSFPFWSHDDSSLASWSPRQLAIPVARLAVGKR